MTLCPIQCRHIISHISTYVWCLNHQKHELISGNVTILILSFGYVTGHAYKNIYDVNIVIFSRPILLQERWRSTCCICPQIWTCLQVYFIWKFIVPFHKLTYILLIGFLAHVSILSLRFGTRYCYCYNRLWTSTAFWTCATHDVIVHFPEHFKLKYHKNEQVYTSFKYIIW